MTPVHGTMRPANPAMLCGLAAAVMAYGWGYRGIVGHEGGAMVPGALLGLAVCLGSNRLDWHRRAAVAGLFGAVGWAWGGSFSYMEQTFYTVSDSFPDVFYGYSCLFLLGGLWAGIGGAVLGLAFTLPRSRLERFVGPFVAISGAFFIVHVYLLFDVDLRDYLARKTAQHFHDADAFAAIIVVVVSAVYALVRRKEREEAVLFLACALAWWAGYLGFTKFGGISLAPPFRNEGWGGVVGILVVLLVYLIRRQNRAALMLSLYGLVGGGIAFALAVFVRHPVRVGWWKFAAWGGTMQWKIAEESFGLFMGLAIALGVLRLARGGLSPAAEDVPPRRLDVFAVFTMLVGLTWINFRRAPMAWVDRYKLVTNEPVAGLMPWTWYTLFGVVFTIVLTYALYLYLRNALPLAPSNAYGKGAFVFLMLMWITVLVGFMQMLPGANKEDHPLVDATFIALSGIATLIVLAHGRAANAATAPAAVAPSSDARWNVGWRYLAVWVVVPVMLLIVSSLSMAMQNGPAEGARLRFGPHAYWREALQVVGTWEVIGTASNVVGDSFKLEPNVIQTVEFARDRSVTLTLRSGETISDTHTWRHKDSIVWLEWYSAVPRHPEQTSIPLTFYGGNIYLTRPPGQDQSGFLVLRPLPSM